MNCSGTIPANTGRIPQKGKTRGPGWDHPREYGENSPFGIQREATKGPSPRIRGESPGEGCFPGSTGTIPANTGRIFLLLSLPRVSRDHPREYGENEAAERALVAARGPSPRIRGECDWFCYYSSHLGTIPANTGRMVLMAGIVSLGRDHPREYGENSTTGRRSSLSLGPSPRIRGELPQPHGWGLAHRTIPANTGRMSRTSSILRADWDHPREYGENWCQRPG